MPILNRFAADDATANQVAAKRKGPMFGKGFEPTLAAVRKLNSRRTIVAELPPLAARCAMGGRFIAAGGGKLAFYFNHFDQLIQEGTKIGLSVSAVRLGTPVISLLELLAGAALIIGLHVRPAALIVLGLVAMYVLLEVIAIGGPLRRDAAFDVSVYAILLAWLSTAGGGRFSLDMLLGRKRDR